MSHRLPLLLSLAVVAFSAPAFAADPATKDPHEAVGHGPSAPKELPAIAKRAAELRAEVHGRTTKEGAANVRGEAHSLLTSLRNICGTKNHPVEKPADHEFCTKAEDDLLVVERHVGNMVR
jgi:hypothetical protein